MHFSTLESSKILFRRSTVPFFSNTHRPLSRKSNRLKVTICGASGQIGQPLCQLLKQSPYIDELAMYDVNATGIIGADLNHIDTRCRITTFTQRTAAAAFQDASVVVICVGNPSIPMKEYPKLLDRNKVRIQEIVGLGAQHCPKAIFAISSPPVEGTVPFASEILKDANCYNPSKVLGITTINCIRANSLVGATLGLEPECVVVPVIGGNIGNTIIPILSEATPSNEFTEVEIEEITSAVQSAHDDIIRAKNGEGAILSMSFSIARFVISVVKAVKGFPSIIECCFVRTSSHPDARYLTLPVLLGPNGIQKDLGVPSMSPYEQCLFDMCIPELVSYIKQGEGYEDAQEEEGSDKSTYNTEYSDDGEFKIENCLPTSPLCGKDWCEKRCLELKECEK